MWNNIKEFYLELSPSIKSTIIITIILIIICIVVHFKLKKHSYDKEPKGIILILEWLIDGINDMCKGMIGKRYKAIAPYITTIAIFIFISNISGLLGLTPPTASVSVTFTLSLMTFFLIEFFGIRTQGVKGWLKGFVDPNPVFLPINLIGEIATPFSLALRLFGNILSGAVIMLMFYTVMGWFSLLITPALHCYFDIFSGFIQTLVFCTLTTVFIAGKIPDEETEYFEV